LVQKLRIVVLQKGRFELGLIASYYGFHKSATPLYAVSVARANIKPHLN
jgi:hypothetical protein